MSRPRVSPKQLDQLLTYMEEHRELAIGRDRYAENESNQKPANSRFSTTALWSDLADKLNSIERGVKRSPIKWCRYWADLKYKAKKRAQSLHAGETLPEIDERVVKLVGAETKNYRSRDDNTLSDEDDHKPILNDDSLDMSTSPMEQADPIEMVNLSQGFDQKLSTEEILAEAAMRSALAAERQAEAVVQGVELFREFISTFRQDVTNLQNIAQSLLDRNLQ